MIAVAFGWQVASIPRPPLDLGLVGLAGFVPLPLLALPAGPARRPAAAPRGDGVLARAPDPDRGAPRRRDARRREGDLAVSRDPSRRGPPDGDRHPPSASPHPRTRARAPRPRY